MEIRAQHRVGSAVDGVVDVEGEGRRRRELQAVVLLQLVAAVEAEEELVTDGPGGESLLHGRVEEVVSPVVDDVVVAAGEPRRGAGQAEVGLGVVVVEDAPPREVPLDSAGEALLQEEGGRLAVLAQPVPGFLVADIDGRHQADVAVGRDQAVVDGRPDQPVLELERHDGALPAEPRE